jgi:hypothetical protein
LPADRWSHNSHGAAGWARTETSTGAVRVRTFAAPAREIGTGAPEDLPIDRHLTVQQNDRTRRNARNLVHRGISQCTDGPGTTVRSRLIGGCELLVVCQVAVVSSARSALRLMG